MNSVPLHRRMSVAVARNGVFRNGHPSRRRFGGAVRSAERFCDPEQGRELGDMVEVHTVELVKYNLDAATISTASKIEQWAFFFLYADRYDSEQLRQLLPGVEFDQAITVIEKICEKTEDRAMYDQREKALRDYQWGLDGARQEGLEKGLEKGREEGEARGVLVGSIVTLQRIVGDPIADVDELKELDAVELNRVWEDLQERLRSRDR